MAANTDEVVIVTGGAKGLGLAYCRALARAGYRVAVADLSDPTPVVEEITDAGGDALGVQVDISDLASTEKMARTVAERWGRIDALVNNAGYFTAIHKKSFDELTVEEWDLAHAVNVRGTWLCCRAVFPYMKAAGTGKVINTSSMTVPSGIPGFLHYVSSKAAIVGLTRALAREVGEHGITVNTISPDYIPHDAEYAGRQPEGMGEMLTNMRCLRREQQPDDMVGTLLYLVGHGSDFVTGQNFYVNGGRLFN
ncbi:MAG TPA: SDR family oxidoreductase [Micromonosporaceae bacterium]|nr:SDR family oxidoreductase [Micromonosporaceae bacterium]